MAVQDTPDPQFLNNISFTAFFVAVLQVKFCYFVAAALNLYFLKKYTTAQLSIVKLFARPLFCALMTCGGATVVYRLAGILFDGGGRINAFILLLITGVTAVAIYVCTMLLFKGISADEVRLLPFGGRLASFLVRKGLLHESN